MLFWCTSAPLQDALTLLSARCALAFAVFFCAILISYWMCERIQAAGVGKVAVLREPCERVEWSCVCESVESWINFRQCVREGDVVLWLSRESSLRRAGHVTSHVLLLRPCLLLFRGPACVCGSPDLGSAGGFKIRGAFSSTRI